jgi:hypothetical protein
LPDKPENGSRSSLELAIFFKAQSLAAIDDFTIWVRCGAVQSSMIGKGRTMVFSQAKVLQGLKPSFLFSPLRPG